MFKTNCPISDIPSIKNDINNYNSFATKLISNILLKREIYKFLDTFDKHLSNAKTIA